MGLQRLLSLPCLGDENMGMPPTIGDLYELSIANRPLLIVHKLTTKRLVKFTGGESASTRTRLSPHLTPILCIGCARGLTAQGSRWGSRCCTDLSARYQGSVSGAVNEQSEHQGHERREGQASPDRV